MHYCSYIVLTVVLKIGIWESICEKSVNAKNKIPITWKYKKENLRQMQIQYII